MVDKNVFTNDSWKALGKWSKIKLFCSPKHVFLMLRYGKVWWKPKYIWLTLLVLVANFRIAKAILAGKL